MAEKLYPARTRCKTCRCAFGALVLKGLYCSYACAGAPAPSANPEDAPRGCKRMVDGAWGFKTRFLAPEQVPERLRKDPASNVYLCDYCLMFHVGHDRPREAEPGRERLARRVADVKTLGTVIERLRTDRGWERRDLARRLGVPIVRVTEAERGYKTVSVALVLAILAELRVDVELAERPVRAR